MTATPFAACALGLVAGVVALAAVRPALSIQDAAEPADPYKELLSGAGEWEGTLTLFAPGASKEATRATEVVEAIGTFWTQSRFDCTLMGMPYVGTGCLGYDPARKKYIGTWIDSMSPHFALMEGDMDPRKKALVMRWKAPDTEGKMTDHRSETVTAKDAYTSTFYTGEGEGTKVMVIQMKRKAGKPAGPGTGK